MGFGILPDPHRCIPHRPVRSVTDLPYADQHQGRPGQLDQGDGLMQEDEGQDDGRHRADTGNNGSVAGTQAPDPFGDQEDRNDGGEDAQPQEEQIDLQRPFQVCQRSGQGKMDEGHRAGEHQHQAGVEDTAQSRNGVAHQEEIGGKGDGTAEDQQRPPAHLGRFPQARYQHQPDPPIGEDQGQSLLPGNGDLPEQGGQDHYNGRIGEQDQSFQPGRHGLQTQEVQEAGPVIPQEREQR